MLLSRASATALNTQHSEQCFHIVFNRIAYDKYSYSLLNAIAAAASQDEEHGTEFEKRKGEWIGSRCV